MYFDDMKTKDVSASSKFIVYALHHDSSPHVYVGQSSKGMKRPKAHSGQANLKCYAHLPRMHWIRSLRKRGQTPEIVVLEQCANEDDLNEAECFHIAYLRSVGASLLNCTDGGDGARGYKHAPVARAKISAGNSGKVRTAEMRAKVSAANKGRKHTPEVRAKLSKLRQGRPLSPLAQERSRLFHKGSTRSPEQRAKQAETMRLRWLEPGFRENQIVKQRAASDEAKKAAQSERIKALHSNPEWKEKARAALRKGWAEKRSRTDEYAAFRQMQDIEQKKRWQNASDEQRRRMGDMARKAWSKPETRQRMIESRRIPCSAEKRAKISAAHRKRRGDPA